MEITDSLQVGEVQTTKLTQIIVCLYFGDKLKANGLFWRKYSLSGELSLLAEDVVSFGGKCQDFENVRSHSNGSPLQ